MTPYASILQTIVHKYQLTNQKCPECGHRWVPPENDGAFKIKKVDFFWINRDQHSFEWFLKLMTQLETDAKEISVGTVTICISSFIVQCTMYNYNVFTSSVYKSVYDNSHLTVQCFLKLFS